MQLRRNLIKCNKVGSIKSVHQCTGIGHRKIHVCTLFKLARYMYMHIFCSLVPRPIPGFQSWDGPGYEATYFIVTLSMV